GRTMPSIEVKHSRGCPCFPATRGFDKPEGCTCQPTYYAVVAEGSKRRRERLGKDKQTAERAFNKLNVEVDEGSYQPVQNIRFSTWADQWRESLQRAKENTRNSYVPTLHYAKRAF